MNKFFPTADQLREHGELIATVPDSAAMLYAYNGIEYVLLIDNTVITRHEDNTVGDEAFFPYPETDPGYPSADELRQHGEWIDTNPDAGADLYKYDGVQYVILSEGTVITRQEDSEVFPPSFPE